MNAYTESMVQWPISKLAPCHVNAGINFIHNHPPRTRLEGSKNNPSGIRTIILYKNPPVGAIQGVKSPTLGHKVRKFHNVSINSDTI